jgi:hypothetical protein
MRKFCVDERKRTIVTLLGDWEFRADEKHLHLIKDFGSLAFG